VLPFGFHHFAVAEAITWGVCSAILAVYVTLFILTFIRNQVKLRVSDDPDFVPGVRIILVLLTGLVVPIQALNAAGIGLEHTFSGFLVGLIYVLVLCSSMFVLLLRFVRSEDRNCISHLVRLHFDVCIWQMVDLGYPQI